MSAMNEALVDNGVSELRAPTLNPVLRVYKRFAQLEGIKIVNLFINNGYQVAVDGEPNLENALELGIQDVRFRRDLPTGIQRAEKASEVSGIPLPTRFDITEVLDHPQPVVAKNTTTDRGEGKYLLETDEQKVRFIAYLLHERRLQTIGVRSIVPGYLDELFTSVRSGNFDADALREISREMGFVQEEFVKAHGEYYASINLSVVNRSICICNYSKRSIIFSMSFYEFFLHKTHLSGYFPKRIGIKIPRSYRSE